MIKSFKEVTVEHLPFVGGKASMLVQMVQKNYPVPEGVVIFSEAFENNRLKPSFKRVLKEVIIKIKKGEQSTEFAVRSSALNEDSSDASFAGQFETKLNLKEDDAIIKAIELVRASGNSKRVKVYQKTKKRSATEVVVILQKMIQAEFSGVLFTADPVTGSFNQMLGNVVQGIGEKLVSGKSNADTFSLSRPKGIYKGSTNIKKYALELYHYASRLEKEFDHPQDIEWVIANKKLYILQSRPITTITHGNYDTYEINDSLAGDFLWTNTNIGEAMPGVFTPFSWSILRMLDKEQERVPGHYLFSGNICGRMYTNASMIFSLATVVGKDPRSLMKMTSDIFDEVPKNMQVPIYPFRRWPTLKAYLSRTRYRLKKIISTLFKLKNYLRDNPKKAEKLIQKIYRVKSKKGLLEIWTNELRDYTFLSMWAMFTGSIKLALVFNFQKKLLKLVGSQESNALISHLRGNEGLESLGPVLGISQVIQGEMTQNDYLSKYGHRATEEFELSLPSPSEDPKWLKQKIKEFKASKINPNIRLEKQKKEHEAALKRFEKNHPDKIKWLKKKLTQMASAAQARETYRSEWTRVTRINRVFALKAGELLKIKEDVFFLYIDEVIQALSEEWSSLKHIPTRKKTYQRYKKLPPFPRLIRGRFDPFLWAKDKHRRLDYFDPNMPTKKQPKTKVLKGFAGAAGRIEGKVRILNHPDEGKKLKKGEILVSSTTNIGWTPIFPKAAAIITDIGAPLSHAAIVARELGIPAVVGCGIATMQLKTGDKVIVDGGKGRVEIL